MEAIFGGKTADGFDMERPREAPKRIELKGSNDPSTSGVKADSGEAPEATSLLKST